jgi:hypothetical protein
VSPTGLAVLAALFVGLASAAQRHATQQVDDHAALLELVGAQLQLGWTEPFRHPALHAVCLLGPAAVLLSQNALQKGHRAAPGWR